MQKSEEWLKIANSRFTPTTFIAYIGRTPVGMIEFVPVRLLKELGLCPCRIDKESHETEDRYTLIRQFDNYVFISCLSVAKDQQGKGVGKALLQSLLESQVLGAYAGALVYARERDQTWEQFIHWPAGSKEFYLKTGFSIVKTLGDPAGCMLCYTRQR